MSVLDEAMKYIKGGISLVPVGTDGLKQPASSVLPPGENGKPSWNPLRSRLPTDAEAGRWWGGPSPAGLAAVCGAASGNLEVIDFDNQCADIFPRWMAAVEEQAPELLLRVAVVDSPRPGVHVWLRCAGPVPGNLKLASDPARPPREQTLIETRGEGGYCLVPGGPDSVHETGRPYRHRSEDLHVYGLAPLTAEEREVLIGTARYFDLAAKQKAASTPQTIPGDVRPGDDFAKNTTWEEILGRHGWRVAGRCGDELRWARPDKDKGWSATTGHCKGKDGEDLLYVFSSSCHPLEAGHAYGKFRAYAALEFSGDLARAAAFLRSQGWGTGKSKAAKTEVVSVLSTVNSPARPRKISPWREFPTHALPSALRRLAEDGAAALGCDAVYVALPGLAVLAAAVGNSRCVMLKRSWKEPSILWTVVVGDSGTLKTPAYRLAMAPMYAIQRRYRDKFKSDMAQHIEDVEAAKEAKKKNDKAGVGAAALDKPSMTRAIASDITVEKLAEMLEDNRRGLLVARDELAGWFGSFTKYKAAGAGSDVPNWLEMYQAGPITVDRKSTERKSIFVDHASVSVTGGIQPGTLARALKEEHFESGLVARLLLAWPPRRAKFWSEDDVPEWTTKKWEECVDSLSTLKLDPASGETPSRPGLVRLSPDAKLLFVKWYSEWAARQDGAEGEIAAAFSKIEAMPARFALIHHCAEAASSGQEVPGEMRPASMEADITLARWFADEAQRVYAMCQSSAAERSAARLVEWVSRQGGSVTARDLQRASGKRMDRDEARARLEALASGGLGAWETRRPGPKGGRPVDVFVLKPTVDTTDTTSDEDDGGDGEETRHNQPSP